MKAIEQEATHIDVEAGVRYWEDATVNGDEEDNDNPTIHGASGDTWQVRIRLADGLIEGWPDATTATVHYKVCDAGEYWLSNAAGHRIAKWKGDYVPGEFLCHGDQGYGDYIIFDVGAYGVIEEYERPSISADDWMPLHTPPEGGS